MATAAPMPRIKLNFSAGAYPPPPEEVVEEDGEIEFDEPESTDDDDDGSVEEHSQSPTPIYRSTEVSTVDTPILDTEPVAPFRPVRIILKAPKWRPDEDEEAAVVPIRRKRKRRKSKTSHRRYDSSTSSEENYIQSGFKTLSGRTVINPNSRKEPSPSPLSNPSFNKSNPPSKSKSKFKTTMSRRPKQRRQSSGWAHSPAKPIHPVRKPIVDPAEAIRLSILNARCVKCHKAADSRDDKIVFCDGCEKPYHQKCHRPNIHQSYIEELEKNWFCFKCVKLLEEEDAEEDFGEVIHEYGDKEEGRYEEDGRRTELINQVQADVEDEDQVYFRDVDTVSELDQEENNYYSAEGEGQLPGTIQFENMEQSMKQLNDEQHKTFIESLSHSELVDLVCRLRANGASFDINLPLGIKDKLLKFMNDKKRKRPATGTDASIEVIERIDKPVSPTSEEEEEENQGTETQQPQTKRRKFTASEEYWLWREDPGNPAITHIVYDNGVGRPAHEANPPLFPYPGKEQPDATRPEERDGGEGKPAVKDNRQN
ncbi:hypothetical protein TWF281_005252 [Arthrobotrys megalospora]